MNYFLNCPKCNEKERITAQTQFVHCQRCGGARYTIDENGAPAFSWSEALNPNSWKVEE